MSEQIETRETLQAEISHNYKQMETARGRGETALIKTFEQRMNGSLARLTDFNAFAGEVASLGAVEPSTAVVLFEKVDGENIIPGEN